MAQTLKHDDEEEVKQLNRTTQQILKQFAGSDTEVRAALSKVALELDAPTRKALFKALIEISPARAVEVEMAWYAKRGTAFDAKTQRVAKQIAENTSYGAASKYLAEQAHSPKKENSEGQEKLGKAMYDATMALGKKVTDFSTSLKQENERLERVNNPTVFGNTGSVNWQKTDEFRATPEALARGRSQFVTITGYRDNSTASPNFKNFDRMVKELGFENISRLPKQSQQKIQECIANARKQFEKLEGVAVTAVEKDTAVFVETDKVLERVSANLQQAWKVAIAANKDLKTQKNEFTWQEGKYDLSVQEIRLSFNIFDGARPSEIMVGTNNWLKAVGLDAGGISQMPKEIQQDVKIMVAEVRAIMQNTGDVEKANKIVKKTIDYAHGSYSTDEGRLAQR